MHNQIIIIINSPSTPGTLAFTSAKTPVKAICTQGSYRTSLLPQRTAHGRRLRVLRCVVRKRLCVGLVYDILSSLADLEADAGSPAADSLVYYI